MSSWPVNVSAEVDWEAYRLKHASIQEQEAAAAAKQEPEPTTRKRTVKTDG
jgi:hypothetical protein